MSRFIFSKIILSLILAFSVGCSSSLNSGAVGQPRSAGPHASPEGVGGAPADEAAVGLDRPFVDPLFEPGGTGVCDELNNQARQPGVGRFSLFHTLRKSQKGELLGVVDVSENPLALAHIASGYSVPTDEDFLAEIRKRQALGELSWWERWWVEGANWVSVGLSGLKYEHFHKRVESDWPGVFGSEADARGAVTLQALHRLGVEMDDVLNSQRLQEILVTKLPLMPLELGVLGAWMESSLRAALPVIREPAKASLAERVCALVLVHRAQGQMLRVKGYQRPSLVQGEGGAYLKKLDAPETGFQAREFLGYAYDSLRGRWRSITEGEISDSSPLKSPVTFTQYPAGATEMVSTPLAASLAVLESSVSILVATLAEQEGDLFWPTEEAHLGAFRLMQMILRTILHENIVSVRGVSQWSDNDQLLLVDSSAGESFVRLADILRFVRSAIRLHGHFQHVGSVHRLSAERENLNVELQRVILPLLRLAQKMHGGVMEGRCASEFTWNAKSGESLVTKECSGGDQALYKKARGEFDRWIQASVGGAPAKTSQ